MLTIIKLPWILLTFPVRLLWRVYMGLWWAFDDSPRSRTQKAAAAEAAAGQDAAFEIVDSSPRPRPAPMGLLRAGFAASATIAVLSGVGLSMLSAGRAIDPATAALGWAWATALTMVVSVWMVRRKAARQRTLRQRVASCASSVSTTVRQGAAGAAAFVGNAAHAARQAVRPAPTGAEATGSPPSSGAGPVRPRRGVESPRPDSAPARVSPVRCAASCARRCCRGAWSAARGGAAFVRDRTPEASRRVRAAWSALRKGPAPSTPETREA